jgi:hypothetical protein
LKWAPVGEAEVFSASVLEQHLVVEKGSPLPVCTMFPSS